jgi:hypothetical protein
MLPEPKAYGKCTGACRLFATATTTYSPLVILNASHAITSRYVIPAFHSPCFI